MIFSKQSKRKQVVEERREVNTCGYFITGEISDLVNSHQHLGGFFYYQSNDYLAAGCYNHSLQRWKNW